jgi:hypothetical protein
MKGTRSSKVSRTARYGVSGLICAVALAVTGCAGPANPTANMAIGSTGAALTEKEFTGQPTPGELTARGWTCITPPTPNRIACSHPTQGFPVFGNPPPADRPAGFSIWLFDGAGNFLGIEKLIRTDLYNGQPCESTGLEWQFRAGVGYYACLRTTGED